MYREMAFHGGMRETGFVLQKVRPGEIVSADIEVQSSSTLFEAGSWLRVVVRGHELRAYPAFGHTDSVNRGRHRLFTGGRYDAVLTGPMVEPSGS